ncbi:hypothetical protein ACFV2I_16005 [Streptomyces microflavus]|uniref:Uncharacterized protein n=1 Tax=Streptomyces microflavus TaxID=1919 RepID=A0A6N9VGD9_STRMI|nr:hypothetical protein [Streptomyces microflavus]NEB71856.1 hypothetical protein [Streptomyces microflavus]QKW43914.1 hypothetical protein HUT09_15970 [Streptomyces microflavus]
MSTIILSITHPVEGSVDIISEETDVVIKARWPFDLETDEWVDIVGRFRRSDLDDLVASVITQPGPHTIELGQDYLTLEGLGEKFLFDLSRGGVVPKRLMLQFPLALLQELRAATTRGDS